MGKINLARKHSEMNKMKCFCQKKKENLDGNFQNLLKATQAGRNKAIWATKSQVYKLKTGSMRLKTGPMRVLMAFWILQLAWIFCYHVRKFIKTSTTAGIKNCKTFFFKSTLNFNFKRILFYSRFAIYLIYG